MEELYYIGLDVHKRTIAYCVKRVDGTRVTEGTVAATRAALREWLETLDAPWIGTLEATLFTGWVYDLLAPHAVELKVAHPQMLKAISASKKKSDRIDAEMLADLLRCDLLPTCYMAPPRIRELRRMLRYRSLVVREATRMKNKMAGLLMEVGAEYSKSRLHGKRYFAELLASVEDVPPSVLELLRLSRASLEMFTEVQQRLVRTLQAMPELRTRVGHLQTVPGVGPITALTWALEIGDPHRFRTARQAISYCGLCSGLHESGGKVYRTRISKQRNKHVQAVLIEAAKFGPWRHPDLAAIHARERERGGHWNRATLAVARKLVTYLLAVDKRRTSFVTADTEDSAVA